VPQKPFGPGRQAALSRTCSDEPSGWRELNAMKVERTFSVTIAGAATRAQGIVELSALQLFFAPYGESCAPLKATPLVAVRMVARDGAVLLPPAPEIDGVLKGEFHFTALRTPGTTRTMNASRRRPTSRFQPGMAAR